MDSAGNSMDLGWWLAIGLSVVISLAVNLITPWVSRRISSSSVKRQQKAERKKLKYEEFEKHLIDNPEALSHYMNHVTQRMILFGVATVVALCLVILLPISEFTSEGMKYATLGVGIILFVLMFQGWIILFRTHHAAIKLRQRVWKTRNWPKPDGWHWY